MMHKLIVPINQITVRQWAELLEDLMILEDNELAKLWIAYNNSDFQNPKEFMKVVEKAKHYSPSDEYILCINYPFSIITSGDEEMMLKELEPYMSDIINRYCKELDADKDWGIPPILSNIFEVNNEEI